MKLNKHDRSLQHYFIEIKNLVSCPDKIYSQLFLATLSQFIIQCPVETLKERLKLSIAVLKLRQGILLPKNAGAEAIADQDAQWTYALFTASLLKGLHPNSFNIIVPKLAKQWLESNACLYQQWKSLLENECDIHNDLDAIIQQASELTHINLTKHVALLGK